MDVILSIDQSTAATKGLVWAFDGRLLARADIPHRQIVDKNGWIEHSPMEILQNTCKAAQQALSAVPSANVAVVGISNQRETAVCWDRITGLPLYNAIVWQCGRAADITDFLKSQKSQKTNKTNEEEVLQRCGLPLSPFFSAAKFKWLLDNVVEVAAAAENGRLCCGTIDSWLIFKLTNGEFLTDLSNASRTQLLNLHNLAWDEVLLDIFGLNADFLPKIAASDSLFGTTDFDGLLPQAAPIHAVLGDSHAALFGNRCHSPFSGKITYGTGSSVMMNVGTDCPPPSPEVAVCLAWHIGGTAEYAIEANINYAGAVIQWLAENAQLLADVKKVGEIAASVANTGGVYFVPAFTGLGAPHFNNTARAAFLGINPTTERAHLIRAAEECIAYQVCDAAESIKRCVGRDFSVLRADGGAINDKFLMQFQADMLNLPLEISQTAELSGMGAAFCAAISAKLVGREEIFAGQKWQKLEPSPQTDEKLYIGWKKAVNLIKGSI